MGHFFLIGLQWCTGYYLFCLVFFLVVGCCFLGKLWSGFPIFTWSRSFCRLFRFKASTKSILYFLCFLAYNCSFLRACGDQIILLWEVEKLLIFAHFLLIIQGVYLLKPPKMFALILVPLRLHFPSLGFLLLITELDFLPSNNPLLARLSPFPNDIVLGLGVDVHQDERITDIVGLYQVVERSICGEGRGMVYL